MEARTTGHPGNVKKLVVVLAAAALSMTPTATADVGHGPPPPPPPCSFTLSAPQRQGEQVIAVVDADGCAPLAVPYSAVACLQPAGGATSCNQAHGSDPAVVAVPYRAATYTATGRGCAGWPGLPPAPDCQLLGPAVAAP